MNEEGSGTSPSSIPSTSTPSSTPSSDPINLISSSGLLDSSSAIKQALLEQQAQILVQSGLLNKSKVSGKDVTLSESKLNLTKSVKQTNQTLSLIAKPKNLLCPLCQEGFNQRNKLEAHLMEVHNVNKERVERLMIIVDQAGDLISGLAKKEEFKSSEENEDSSSNGCLDTGDGKSDCSGDSNSSREEYFDQQSNKYLKSGNDVSVSVSERHVYKYRCNQCSLAFKTMEKLQLHSQYHLIRAATQCALCSRSFRSFEALHKHVESSHHDMSEEELDAYRQSLVNNSLLLNDRNGGGILDPSTTELLKKESNRIDDMSINEEEAVDLVINPASVNNVMSTLGNGNNSETAEEGSDADGTEAKLALSETSLNPEDGSYLEDYLNSQSVAEDNYNDPNRKYKCHRCKVAFTRQSYLTSHNKTLLHRKGEKLSYPMEKYLDPNRPHKCDICKESFTQKNILLVHYNSVSHLHKSKQAQKESLIQNNLNCINSTNEPNASQSSSFPASAGFANFSNNSSTNGNTVISSVVNSTAPAANTVVSNINSTSSSNDYDKKPYRCNICKVGYNIEPTLDIHIRSVLHQTRASKLHDLAISGQLDLSQPLIERADSAIGDSASLSANTSSSLKTETKASPLLNKSENSITSSPSSTPKNATDPSLMTLAGLSEQELHQQVVALNLAAADPLLLSANQASLAAVAAAASASASNSGTGLFSCSRCNVFFPTQESCFQHQQFCCLFNPPSHSNIANLFKNSSALTQQAKEILAQTQLAQDQLSTIRNQTKYYNAPICRSKPPVYKHLLETWGFEIVMQFNEYHQRKKRVKEDFEKKQEKQEKQESSDVFSSDEKTETDSKLEKAEAKVNLPEINRSNCEYCNKEFSSIWVLKAHKEEVHKKVVTFNLVEKFANEYRKDYDKRLSINNNDEESSANISSEQVSRSNSSANNLENVLSSTNNTTLSESENESAGKASQAISSSASNVLTTTSEVANNLGEMSAASQMAAQLQFSQLLMSMGLAGIGMPMGMNVPFAATAMGLHPPMIPLMMAPHIDPVMAAAFNHSAAVSGNNLVNSSAASSSSTAPNTTLAPDPNFFAAQQKILQQQHQLTNAQQQKRARTRITDDQLKILRQYFDINNSPTEEALQEMSEKSGLPLKVIKHWFRNTLFKERQRNKDSPYNFNNPPSTFLNLEEYEKTGEAKVIPIDEAVGKDKEEKIHSEKCEISLTLQEVKDFADNKSRFDYDLTSSDEDATVKKEESKSESKSDEKQSEGFEQSFTKASSQARSLNNSNKVNQLLHGKASSIQQQRDSFEYSKSFTMSPRSDSSISSVSTNDTSSQPTNQTPSSIFSSLPAFASAAALSSSLGANPLQLALDAHRASVAGGSVTSPSTANTSNQSLNLSSSQGVTPGKRANRTRFTDYQIKVLQEFFESNAYPKDDDLEYLSKLLNLSPRVIVVWFQNARQKARKVYENQPPIQEEEQSGKFQRTPGLNYQCKKCMQVFQRYYELIKHQKSSCFKDENPLAIQIKAAEEARQAASNSPGAASSASSSGTPVSSSALLDKVSNVSHASQSNSQQTGAFRCEKCSLVFPRFDLWREHQLVHLMNPNLFSTYPPTSPFGILHYEAAQQAQLSAGATSLIGSGPQSLPQSAASLVNQLQFNSTNPLASTLKRKLPEDEDSHDSQSCSGSQSGGNHGEQPRDKRLRTTILPEQLDYLYQKYQIESNPSRKMLENIAKEVGLKKRVVQVWFQNTRARERKGQFRAHQQVIHKRCPFCRALFKARSALESHLATRHADQYTKGDINIDALPDGDPSEDQAEEVKSILTPEILQNQMKQYYSLKKYIDEMNLNQSLTKDANLSSELTLNLKTAIERGSLGDLPLDLSKPIDLSSGLSKFGDDEMMVYGSRSEPEDSDSESDLGGDDGCSYDSTSNLLITSPSALANNCQLKSSPSSCSSSKRFRTQMTTVQLKVS